MFETCLVLYVLCIIQLACGIVSVSDKSIIIDGRVNEFLADVLMSTALLVNSRVWLFRPLLMKLELFM